MKEAKVKNRITTLRVREETRRLVMIDKQELGLKTTDDLILLYHNTHMIHNRTNNKK
ncbi:MAG: hypothetical protein IH948_00080 [Bacteroidetes bacterium]|nr:hypothetical protein [Bacteroidota bacterium]